MGNRFNPWHMQGFALLTDKPEIVAFRADSEIQRYFRERGDGTLEHTVEPIYFDTQVGSPLTRLRNTLLTRYAGREAHIVPFHERLQGFDLIHSWELFTDWSAEALEARERWGIPLAVMVWDNIPFNMERNPRRRDIKRRVSSGADRFIVYTERSRRMLDVEGVPAERVALIPPGVNTEMFAPGPSARDQFGLDPDDFVILFVGWLLPRKGIDFLLLAMRELLRDPAMKGRRLRLLMVGSGPGRDRVEGLIARLGIDSACTFAGSVPYGRMPEVFRSADCFALPSIATAEWQEQFGMAIIEAMACGLPVVTTFSGAIPEITGDAAVLCQPNDFFALHQALRSLILEPNRRADLAAAGRARAVERFDLREHARALSDVYDRMLQR